MQRIQNRLEYHTTNQTHSTISNHQTNIESSGYDSGYFKVHHCEINKQHKNEKLMLNVVF